LKSGRASSRHKVLQSSRVPLTIVVGDATSRLERLGVPASIGAAIAALLIAAE